MFETAKSRSPDAWSPALAAERQPQILRFVSARADFLRMTAERVGWVTNGPSVYNRHE